MTRDVQLNMRVTEETVAFAKALQEHYRAKLGVPVSLPTVVDKVLREEAKREHVTIHGLQ